MLEQSSDHSGHLQCLFIQPRQLVNPCGDHALQRGRNVDRAKRRHLVRHSNIATFDGDHARVDERADNLFNKEGVSFSFVENQMTHCVG